MTLSSIQVKEYKRIIMWWYYLVRCIANLESKQMAWYDNQQSLVSACTGSSNKQEHKLKQRYSLASRSDGLWIVLRYNGFSMCLNHCPTPDVHIFLKKLMLLYISGTWKCFSRVHMSGKFVTVAECWFALLAAFSAVFSCQQCNPEHMC